MRKCDQCLSIGDMGGCQNFKSDYYGEDVSKQKVPATCEEYERDCKK